MKKIILLSVLFVLAGLLVSQSTKAQKVDMNTGLVVWTGTNLSDAAAGSAVGKFYYLLEFKSSLDANNPELYMSSGGSYGVQGVLSSVGMRVQILKNSGGDTYQVVTRVKNAKATQQTTWLGDRMGFTGNNTGTQLYLDRGATENPKGSSTGNESYPNWIITYSPQTKTGITYKDESSSHDVSVQTYIFSNNCPERTNWGTTNHLQYICKSGNNLVSGSSTNAIKWVIVSEDDYNTAMKQVTWGEVDLGVFVQDAEFGRDNKDALLWEWGTWSGADWNKMTNQNDSWTVTDDDKHWHQRNQDKMCNGFVFTNSNKIQPSVLGTNIANNQEYDVEGFRNHFARYYKAEIYNEAIALSQTLKGSNIPNLTNGLYRLTAQALYDDGEGGLTNDGVSYFVVKRVEHKEGQPDEVSIQRLPIMAMNKLEDNGITAQSGVSAGYVMNGDANANNYLLEFFLEISGNTDITIGIEQTKAKGWTVIGNVHLYAHGKQAIFLDEDWCPDTRVPYINNTHEEWSTGDPYEHTQFNIRYQYPATCYYNRTFAKDVDPDLANKFNPICLPIDLTGNQVRQAFGNDCMLSELERVTDGAWKVIVFKPVDLNAEGTVMHKGVPYILKVTTNPMVAKGDRITLEVGNGGQNHTVTIDGPIYALPGVTKKQTTGLPELRDVTKDGITFTGTFYYTSLTQDEVKNGDQDYWLIRKGDMYHLDGNNPGKIYQYYYEEYEEDGKTKHISENRPTGGPGYMIWGTYAYLHAPKEVTGDAKNLTFGIEDEFGDITAIDIEGMEVAHSQAIEDSSVYTLNGQKIGGQGNLNSLSKGIYIVNGKKYVVK